MILPFIDLTEVWGGENTADFYHVSSCRLSGCPVLNSWLVLFSTTYSPKRLPIGISQKKRLPIGSIISLSNQIVGKFGRTKKKNEAVTLHFSTPPGSCPAAPFLLQNLNSDFFWFEFGLQIRSIVIKGDDLTSLAKNQRQTRQPAGSWMVPWTRGNQAVVHVCIKQNLYGAFDALSNHFSVKLSRFMWASADFDGSSLQRFYSTLFIHPHLSFQAWMDRGQIKQNKA